MLLAAVLVVAVALASGDQQAGLTRLHQVSLSVELTQPLPATTAEDLAAQLGSLLREAYPPLRIHDDVADRIRLTISVRPMSATELRGFWLPFSGTYGIGAVRLGVQRMVNAPGEPRSVPAIVWQTERTVGSPWQAVDSQIVRLVDEMVAELLAASRRRMHE